MARSKHKKVQRGAMLFRNGDEVVVATKWRIIFKDGKAVYYPLETFTVTESFLKIHAQMIDEKIKPDAETKGPRVVKP